MQGCCRTDPMSLILSILGGLFLLMALAGTVFAAAAVMVMARFLRRVPASPNGTPLVTILRPMKGLDPEADANLMSLCDQDYAGRVQIVLGADSQTDPSIAAARSSPGARRRSRDRSGCRPRARSAPARRSPGRTGSSDWRRPRDRAPSSV